MSDRRLSLECYSGSCPGHLLRSKLLKIVSFIFIFTLKIHFYVKIHSIVYMYCVQIIGYRLRPIIYGQSWQTLFFDYFVLTFYSKQFDDDVAIFYNDNAN